MVVILKKHTAREQCAVVGDVRPTIGATEHHMCCMCSALEQQAYLLLAGCTLLSVGNDWTTRPTRRLSGGGKGLALMRCQLFLASSNFDDAGSVGHGACLIANGVDDLPHEHLDQFLPMHR